MLSCKAVVGLIVVAVVCGTAHSIVVRLYYEERISYRKNPECAPSTLDKGIKCADIGETMTVRGDLGDNNRWTLFVHCWRAKTPENPESTEIATSFNVFNLDPVFTKEDRAKVIDELKRRGFNTDPQNLIEFDYAGTPCAGN
ncbi:hypothetical protein HA402_002763 [Bradysia odoriphaga]|nr:hypothetical protein HA402_002763 [Bradysia odoriphaga]